MSRLKDRFQESLISLESSALLVGDMIQSPLRPLHTLLLEVAIPFGRSCYNFACLANLYISRAVFAARKFSLREVCHFIHKMMS